AINIYPSGFHCPNILMPIYTASVHHSFCLLHSVFFSTKNLFSMNIKHINSHKAEDKLHNNEAIADFLFHHLDQYGDKKEDILKCLAYVFNPEKGGDIFLCIENESIIGAVVINHTGMEGY